MTRDTKSKLQSREDGGRSVWSTTLIFLTLMVLTALMFLGARFMITGSIKPYDRIEIQGVKGP